MLWARNKSTALCLARSPKARVAQSATVILLRALCAAAVCGTTVWRVGVLVLALNGCSWLDIVREDRSVLDVYEQACRALREADWEGLYALYSRDLRKTTDPAGLARQYEAERDRLTAYLAEACVAQVTVDGDTATVYLSWTDAGWHAIPFVREEDAWKIHGGFGLDR